MLYVEVDGVAQLPRQAHWCPYHTEPVEATGYALVEADGRLANVPVCDAHREGPLPDPRLGLLPVLAHAQAPHVVPTGDGGGCC